MTYLLAIYADADTVLVVTAREDFSLIFRLSSISLNKGFVVNIPVQYLVVYSSLSGLVWSGLVRIEMSGLLLLVLIARRDGRRVAKQNMPLMLYLYKYSSLLVAEN